MNGVEPLTEQLRQRMSAQRTVDTAPEVALRRILFSRGWRYRINYKVPGLPRRTIDIAFPRLRVAVFVDGCFWHGCPDHCVQPKHNADWWAQKLQKNRMRDDETSGHLVDIGWRVIRVWEHASPRESSAAVEAVLREARGSTP